MSYWLTIGCCVYLSWWVSYGDVHDFSIMLAALLTGIVIVIEIAQWSIRHIDDSEIEDDWW